MHCVTWDGVTREGRREHGGNALRKMRTRITPKIPPSSTGRPGTARTCRRCCCLGGSASCAVVLTDRRLGRRALVWRRRGDDSPRKLRRKKGLGRGTGRQRGRGGEDRESLGARQSQTRGAVHGREQSLRRSRGEPGAQRTGRGTSGRAGRTWGGDDAGACCGSGGGGRRSRGTGAGDQQADLRDGWAGAWHGPESGHGGGAKRREALAGESSQAGRGSG